MNFLLDTCVVSELVRQTPDPHVIRWVRSEPEGRLYLSVLTIGEIRPLLIKAITGIMAGEVWAPRHLMQPIRQDLLQVDDGSFIYRHPERIKEWVKWH